MLNRKILSARPQDFVAVDVETANPDVSSICQIGIAVVRSSEITELWTQLVDPGDYFHPGNIGVHGITSGMVADSPGFEDIYDKVAEYLEGTVVSHTFFDRRAIQKACELYGKTLSYKAWIDSAQVARRAWPEKYASGGYNLGNIAGDLEISFNHHDAGEDARVSAEIVLRACSETDFRFEELLKVLQRKNRRRPALK